MNILMIQGSPRSHGCSAALAGHFGAAAEACGATVATVELNDLEFAGCRGCMLCKEHSDCCVQSDDLTPVLAAMHGADILVFASPVYVGEVSGQFKLFLDRTYSLLTRDFQTGPRRSRLPRGKKLVFVLTQGAPAEYHADLIERYRGVMAWYEFSEVHFLRACNVNTPEDLALQPGLLEQATTLAEGLVNSGEAGTSGALNACR